MTAIKQMWMLLFMVGIIPFYSCLSQEVQNKKMVIVIDPGHGAVDLGAIGINGLKEKDVVLKIASQMLKWNKTVLNNEYDIYLTRYSDTLISLSHRAKLTTILRPDLFISLHCNHSTNTKARGIEVFVHTYAYSSNGKQSVVIATLIIKQLHKKLGYKTRGVKKANFQVLRQTINTCPSMLIELGFLSNKDESDYLTKKENINALALAILMSIKI